MAAAIKPICTARTAEAALAELDAFESGPWGKKFPTVVAAWRRGRDKAIPFFAFPPDVRRVIYTTNAIGSVNARLRNITADWARASPHWKAAMNQLAILYEELFTQAA